MGGKMMEGQSMPDHMKEHMAAGEQPMGSGVSMGGAAGDQGMEMDAGRMMHGSRNPHCHPDGDSVPPRP
jgi:hypothetical protein